MVCFCQGVFCLYMEEYNISFFKCVKSTKVLRQINIIEWISMIRSSEYSDLISQARNNLLEYEDVKLYQVPCVTLNFNYKNKKRTSNSIGGTGLMFIDIDAPDFNINKVDKKLILAYYKSFGGNGYGIIVKVDGLTELNFDDTYYDICYKLNIVEYVDIGAKKATQFNALTFDKDAYFNENSKIFKSINTPLIETKREKRAYSTEWGVNNSNIRFNNRSDFFTGKEEEQYLINTEERFEIIEAKVLFKKVSKNRNNILLSYCNNIVILNPQIHQDRLWNIMTSVNEMNFTNPVNLEQLRKIINSVNNYKEDGTLKPIYQKKKRIVVFNPYNSIYSKEEKFSIARKIWCGKRTEDTIKKLSKIIEEWDFKSLGKISQNKIIKNNPISKKSVEKYYCKFKEIIEISNKKFGKS